MKKLSLAFAAFALAGMTATPALANPASSLSIVDSARASASIEDGNDLFGGSLLLSLVAAAAAVGLVVSVVDGDSDDLPDSP